MKNIYLKILTLFSLLIIIVLQTLWLCNTYSLIESNICKEVNPDGRKLGTTKDGPGRTTIYTMVS